MCAVHVPIDFSNDLSCMTCSSCCTFQLYVAPLAGAQYCICRKFRVVRLWHCAAHLRQDVNDCRIQINQRQHHSNVEALFKSVPRKALFLFRYTIVIYFVLYSRYTGVLGDDYVPDKLTKPPNTFHLFASATIPRKSKF